jgi:hypothetical protein
MHLCSLLFFFIYSVIFMCVSVCITNFMYFILQVYFDREIHLTQQGKLFVS